MKFIILLNLIALNSFAQMIELPPGLGGEASQESNSNYVEVRDDSESEGETNWDFTKYTYAHFGLRTQDDPKQKDLSAGETSLRFEAMYENDFTFKFATDLRYDFSLEHPGRTNLRTGTGLIDLREFYYSDTYGNNTDVKIGRQILTWGTGDLIFINDLFPKDWKSFFSGRDLTYLKAPSDAVKISHFTDIVDIDFVLVPAFNSDRHIDGTRNSYFSPTRQQIVGRETNFNKQTQDDPEYHMRLKKIIGSTEYSLYGYKGFWKSPMGINNAGSFYFPKLNVYGTSMRGSVLSGVGYFEYGYYDSTEDKHGIIATVPNSESRALIGYEKEIFAKLTASVQYYVEHMHNYDMYKRYNQGRRRSENRQMVSTKLSYSMLQDTLFFTAMNFYSPTDIDGHLRLNADYKLRDNVKIGLGSHQFYGKYIDTFWGQFENNSSIFGTLKVDF